MQFKPIVLLLVLYLSWDQNLCGQAGFFATYQQSDFKTWKEMITENLPEGHATLKNGFQTGLDYGFGLENVRIDLFPGAFYRFAKSEQSSLAHELYLYAFESTIHQIGIGIQVNIYPLDLLSRQSMECPSFYRGAEKFTKGWFIAAKPSLIYSMKTGLPSYFPDVAIEPQTSSKVILDFAIGTGLDIGINKKISLTPYIMYGFSVGERWNGLSNYFEEPSYNDTTQANHLFAGIRLGYWW